MLQQIEISVSEMDKHKTNHILGVSRNESQKSLIRIFICTTENWSEEPGSYMRLKISVF